MKHTPREKYPSGVDTPLNVGQDAIDHAEGLVTDRQKGTLSGSFARGWLLATVGICPAMRGRRDEPQGIMIKPLSEVGAAHVGDVREFADTGAAVEEADIEARQFDERFAIAILADITHGGQDGRGSGGADPRQLHEELAGWARRK
jgi:hypothetical protein